MKYCPNCGAPIEAEHKFCANCGAKLEAAPVELPREPVYTDDPALTQNPVLNTPPSFDPPKPKAEKIPELTLEPDLWDLGAAAAVQSAPEPAPAAQAEPVQTGALATQAPPAQERQEERPSTEEQTPLHELPHDYTMSQPEQELPQEALPDENLLLAWSIILTVLCSICGIVGLVKVLKARKAPWSEKARLLKSAKTWLIVGTVIRALGFFGSLA